MKPYINVINLVLCFVFCSCSQTQEKNTNEITDHSEEEMAVAIDSVVALIDSENEEYEEENDDYEDEEDSGDAIKTKLAKAIQCIAENDAEGFASRCHYPVNINSIDKIVDTPEEMVQLFNILFPEDQRQLFKNKNENDWEEMGWRGIMYSDGDFWDENFDGKISAINYSSKETERLEEKKKEMASSCLHPSLQNKDWEITQSYKCDNGIIFRIDYRAKDEKYRFLLFEQGKSFNEIPNYVMYGEYSNNDNGYHFSDDNGNSAVFYKFTVYIDSPYSLKISDSTNVDGITPVNWLDLMK